MKQNHVTNNMLRGFAQLRMRDLGRNKINIYFILRQNVRHLEQLLVW